MSSSNSEKRCVVDVPKFEGVGLATFVLHVQNADCVSASVLARLSPDGKVGFKTLPSRRIKIEFSVLAKSDEDIIDHTNRISDLLRADKFRVVCDLHGSMPSRAPITSKSVLNA